MDILPGSCLPIDQRAVEKVADGLQSQGIIEKFSKQCIPNVRDAVLKSIYETGILDKVVERIVDQVLTTKVTAALADTLVHKCLTLGSEVTTSVSSCTSIQTTQKNYLEIGESKSAEPSCSNSNKIENTNKEKQDKIHLELQKIKLPKFASNMKEAMKITKIRKQLKRLEGMTYLSSDNEEVKRLLKDVEELSKCGKKEKNKKINKEKIRAPPSIKRKRGRPKKLVVPNVNINEFILSSNISLAKWNELEEKFGKEIGCIDVNSYDSPTEEESIFQNPNKEVINDKIDHDKIVTEKNEEEHINAYNAEINENIILEAYMETPNVLNPLDDQFIQEEVIEETIEMVDVSINNDEQFIEEIIEESSNPNTVYHSFFEALNGMDSFEIDESETPEYTHFLEITECESIGDEKEFNIFSHSNGLPDEVNKNSTPSLKPNKNVKRNRNCSSQKAVVLLKKMAQIEDMIEKKSNKKSCSETLLNNEKDIFKSKSLKVPDNEKENTGMSRSVPFPKRVHFSKDLRKKKLKNGLNKIFSSTKKKKITNGECIISNNNLEQLGSERLNTKSCVTDINPMKSIYASKRKITVPYEDFDEEDSLPLRPPKRDTSAFIEEKSHTVHKKRKTKEKITKKTNGHKTYSQRINTKNFESAIHPMESIFASKKTLPPKDSDQDNLRLCPGNKRSPSLIKEKLPTVDKKKKTKEKISVKSSSHKSCIKQKNSRESVKAQKNNVNKNGKKSVHFAYT